MIMDLHKYLPFFFFFFFFFLKNEFLRVFGGFLQAKKLNI